MPRLLPLGLVVAATLLAPSLSHAQAQPTAPSSDQLPAQPTALENPIPAADPAAIVTAGNVRFTVLTPQLLRLEYAPDAHFVDDPSFIVLNRRLPVPPFRKSISAREITLDTADLHLVYKRDAGSATGFTPENLSITLKVDGQPVTWHPGTPSTGNLLGTTRTLDGAKGEQNLREPMGQGIVSRAGWAVIDDSGPLFDSANFNPQGSSPATQPWVKERPAGPRADVYFFGYGHNYKQALGDYVRIAGRIPLPPRFAFGAWWSRYWAYSDGELRDLVEGFRQTNVPLDVFVIDMDWHQTFGRRFQTEDASGHPKGWSGYTWDHALFPDPPAFLSELHDDGLKVTLNLHPASGVQPWEAAYPAFARNMGVDPATGKYIPFDLTDRKFATNYLDLLHHPLEKQGVDFWWLDWQQEANTRTAGVNPTWWLNYIHFTDQEHEGKRPLLFHRWGGLGNHRYQIGFSGDTVSVWDSLAFQPWFTATAANVGYAYWSHDIGGHMPGAVDPELYTRWIQFGIFSPILRTHTTKNAEAERRIWAYPEPYSDQMRRAFQLRYAMQPYLYTEGRRTFDTGVAFDRPLYYDFPEASEAYTTRNEYMFGDNLLVAPVVTPADPTSGLASEHIWLPKGDWIEWSTGAHLQGPVSLDRHYAISDYPVFVRPGSIVPMQAPELHSHPGAATSLQLAVYPLANGQTSQYSLYEDDGVAEDYQRNQGIAWTDVTAKQTGDELTVTVAPVRGGFTGFPAKRPVELRLPADWPPDSVTVNGQPLTFTLSNHQPGWHFEGNTLTTIIPAGEMDTHTATTFTVRRARGSLAARSELNGFAGKTSRLMEAYKELSNDYPATAAVPDDITVAMQTGDRLGYHPETARTELAAFPTRYTAALKAAQTLADQAKPETKSVSGAPATTPQQANETKSHQTHAQHALADLQAGTTP